MSGAYAITSGATICCALARTLVALIVGGTDQAVVAGVGVIGVVTTLLEYRALVLCALITIVAESFLGRIDDDVVDLITTIFCTTDVIVDVRRNTRLTTKRGITCLITVAELTIIAIDAGVDAASLTVDEVADVRCTEVIVVAVAILRTGRRGQIDRPAHDLALIARL